jgi:hypothetical protein
MNGSTVSRLGNYLPAVVDLVAMLLFTLLVPGLAERFADSSIVNAVIIGGVYLLFCGAVFLLKRLESGGGSWRSGTGLAALGVFFGIMIAFLLAETSGLLDEGGLDRINTENALHMAGVVFGVLLWLAFVFLYPVILAADVKPNIGWGTRKYWLFELLGLAGANLMILVATAGWAAMFAGTEPYDDLGFGGKALIFALTYIFFLLFFAPPRLVFVARNPRISSYATFIVQSAYYVWLFVSTTAW